MRTRSFLLAAGLLASGLMPLALSTPAGAAVAKYADDYNGDGYRDLAVGAPGTDVGGASSAGAVVVLYGSKSGASAANRSVITQNTTGVAGSAERQDNFGASLASADFNKDGYADLAVGATGEGVGVDSYVGQVTILWGGKKGLSGGTALPQPSDIAAEHAYSHGLAAADFNGDGSPDLTVTGEWQTRIYNGPFKKTTGNAASASYVGTVGATRDVGAGDLTGDKAAERVYPYATTSHPGGQVRYHTYNGKKTVVVDMPKAEGNSRVTIGDINGDGYGDLVLADPGDPANQDGAGHLGGQVEIWYGGKGGPDLTQTPTVINQDTPGVPGTGEEADFFGGSLSLGDINGDKYADLAVGAQYEGLNGKRWVGTVTVLYGSAAGLTTKGAATYSQDTAGVPGTAETQDGFGSAVRLIDLDKNGKAELVTTAPGENAKGALLVLKGTASGLTTKGAKSITAANVGLKGTANSFGAHLAQ
ncbi:FG-GAP-like repeat-containing protein [Streptomyces europaeiscabiei]|uniref:FG-GAP-like repeat-containing protein n=1 Tax=Streptomyces europaeiscabiei TaxID=146819 RepID=UPI0029B3816D|nr:FG-GAP-like repeat-containing protein [Streptomyces europaeiscabiei]MDX3831040.1 FG-GAP-like repeat-containing protein [Streptomyces europaeiscabiei]